MIKKLICLLWGHSTFVKIETAVHAPQGFGDFEGRMSQETLMSIIDLRRGSTTVSLQCPWCGKVRVVQQ